MTQEQPRLTTRPLEPRDVPILDGWLRGTGLGAPREVRGAWRRALADPRIVCRLGLDAAGEPVGFYRLDLAPDQSAELTLVVGPRCWRQKVGTALLEAALAEARRRGLRRLLAMVASDNAPAREFFLAADFDVTASSSPTFLTFTRIVHTGDSVVPLEIEVTP